MRSATGTHIHAIGVLFLIGCSSPPAEASGQDTWITDFSKRTVPLEQIVSGGPPKDGIRSIDAPKFVSAREADRWLEDPEPVGVVRVGDEVKAYPLQILIFHEIVNDVVGEKPVTVTYCPLCNTTLAFERAFDGRLLDFGTTGRLRHSDLVMYDRQTESWWQQATGEGIVGAYAGRQLVFVPASVMSWEDVREQFEGVKVLSRETGIEGRAPPYGRSPYATYDRGRGPIRQFFGFGRDDDRLQAMERIVALDFGGEALAVPFSELEDVRVANVEVGGVRVAVLWAPGTASAVDRQYMAQGRDVGASATYDPVVGGRVLTFENAGDGRFRDRETGSVWNLAGRAIGGELAGAQLTEVVHGNHFWFAWGTFKPDTEVWRR
jgi:hypothetical protein